MPKTNPIPTPDLLTPAEVAALFRVDAKTVTRWAKAGKLAAVQTLGGHRRYRADEVHAILAGVPVANIDYPAAVRQADGLTGHTVTVERLEDGRLAAIERTDGRYGTTRHVAEDGQDPATVEQIAVAAAAILGATYVAVAR